MTKRLATVAAGVHVQLTVVRSAGPLPTGNRWQGLSGDCQPARILRDFAPPAEYSSCDSYREVLGHEGPARADRGDGRLPRRVAAARARAPALPGAGRQGVHVQLASHRCAERFAGRAGEGPPGAGRDSHPRVALLSDRQAHDVVADCERILESFADEVVLLSSRPDMSLLLGCMAAGARSFVMEGDRPEILLDGAPVCCAAPHLHGAEDARPARRLACRPGAGAWRAGAGQPRR